MQKEKRIIDTLEPVMNRHRLIVDVSVVKNDLKHLDSEPIQYSLFHQLTRLTKDRGSIKYDDRLDALCGAVAYWLDAMARDEALSVKKYNEDQLDTQLQAFIEDSFGTRRSGENWLDN
ncbi:MAG: hypothetical protein LLF28_07885 [Nitrospiraceae bacterium]|nr:hypothetical protein [Nitrospiraceae bacterium]